MYSFNLAVVLLFAVLVTAAPQQPPSGIPPVTEGWSLESMPNPIGKIYPTTVTGTTNGTIFVIPIKYADENFPFNTTKWPVLWSTIHELYPTLPAGTFPLIIHAALDHDVEVGGQTVIPDFQSIRIMYPFVDYLRDGYTSFVYSKNILITDWNLFSQNAVRVYGNVPFPAKFTPDHEAYRALAAPSYSSSLESGTFMNADIVGDTVPGVGLTGSVHTSATDYNGPDQIPWHFFVNITNQFGVSDLEVCRHQRTFFNYTLSEGNHAPRAILGHVSIPASLVPSAVDASGVQGMRLDYAFTEDPIISCAAAQGYPITY